MKLRKGLSLVAFGFLFTLVNINLNFSESASLNIFPDFLGWLFFLLAYPCLLPYTERQPLIRWLPLFMLVYTAIDWYANLAGTPLDVGILGIIPAALELAFLYLLFGCLIRVAEDHAPSLSPRLRSLRTLNLALAAGIYALTLLTYATQIGELLLLIGLCGLVALIVAIYTCFTLFKLRSSVAAAP